MRRRVKQTTLIRSTDTETNYTIVRRAQKRIKSIKKLPNYTPPKILANKDNPFYIDGSVR